MYALIILGIHLIFGILILTTMGYNVISEESLLSSPINVSKQYPVFKQFLTNLLKILLRLMHFLLISDKLLKISSILVHWSVSHATKMSSMFVIFSYFF